MPTDTTPATPTHTTQTPSTDKPPHNQLQAWVEQLDAQQDAVAEPMPTYKALKPGYTQQNYPYDPTLSDIIADGAVSNPGAPIVVYTSAFNRPPDYMLLSLVHFLCMNPITGSVALFFSIASLRASDRGDVARARRLGVYSLWLSSVVVLAFFIVSIVCLVFYVQVQGRGPIDVGK